MTPKIGLEPGSVGGLAYDALTMAHDAKAKADSVEQALNSHEEVCAERYSNINKSLETMKVEFKASNDRIWKLFAWIGGTGFLLLMSVLGFLLKAQFDTIGEMSKATAQRSELLERTQPQAPQVIIQRAPGSPDMGAVVEQQPTSRR